jgi:hypothetical protein
MGFLISNVADNRRNIGSAYAVALSLVAPASCRLFALSRCSSPFPVIPSAVEGPLFPAHGSRERASIPNRPPLSPFTFAHLEDEGPGFLSYAATPDDGPQREPLQFREISSSLPTYKRKPAGAIHLQFQNFLRARVQRPCWLCSFLAFRPKRKAQDSAHVCQGRNPIGLGE